MGAEPTKDAPLRAGSRVLVPRHITAPPHGWAPGRMHCARTASGRPSSADQHRSGSSLKVPSACSIWQSRRRWYFGEPATRQPVRTSSAPQPLKHLGVEHHVKPAAMDSILRPVVASQRSSCFAVDVVAVEADQRPLLGRQTTLSRSSRLIPRSSSSRTALGWILIPTPSGLDFPDRFQRRCMAPRSGEGSGPSPARQCRRRRSIPVLFCMIFPNPKKPVITELASTSSGLG